MKLESMIRISEAIRSSYDLSDPASLCKELGIRLLHYPMGETAGSCKGFIVEFDGAVAITVNSDLGAVTQKLITFHELSHYFLHIRTGLCKMLQDCSVCDSASDMEYEANLLTAELMLEDDAVLSLLSEGTDFFDAAASLNVIPELLDFKLRLLRAKGARIPQAPLASTGIFLRRMTSETTAV